MCGAECVDAEESRGVCVCVCLSVCKTICFHTEKGNNETKLAYVLRDNQLGARNNDDKTDFLII